MTAANIAILFFFFFVMSVGGVAAFFSSDYAQKRWGTQDESTKDMDSPLVIVSDYRVRKR